MPSYFHSLFRDSDKLSVLSASESAPADNELSDPHLNVDSIDILTAEGLKIRDTSVSRLEANNSYNNDKLLTPSYRKTRFSSPSLQSKHSDGSHRNWRNGRWVN
jgi:hypothetical protein